jgi:hypothetical protein
VTAIAVTAAAAITPSAALAAPASCATAPASYAGSDPVVAQLVALQTDADADCQALSDRLDAVDGDVTAGAAAAHTDAADVRSKLADLDATIDGWTSSAPLNVTLPSGGGGEAVEVSNWPSDQTVALDSPSLQAQDGEADGLHDDLWVLIGAIVGTFALSEVLRKVWP